VIGYLRKSKAQNIFCLHHFLPETVENYSLPLSGVARVSELFNTDRKEWGGSGIIHEEVKIKDGQIVLTLPPLATLVFEIEFIS